MGGVRGRTGEYDEEGPGRAGGKLGDGHGENPEFDGLCRKARGQDGVESRAVGSIQLTICQRSRPVARLETAAKGQRVQAIDLGGRISPGGSNG